MKKTLKQLLLKISSEIDKVKSAPKGALFLWIGFVVPGFYSSYAQFRENGFGLLDFRLNLYI
ncbi:hypothetical protein APR42_06875 [Salegentibacter mishustinae]|uniref:Uncharacterized protein n=1 Tax=Salegentibacter mishustinae TaxID=270918 RepID=A0A0Q9Z8W2_9FLAO|nr:hypothetical protein APR42_06875 [Salegentibacter mishustinae]